MQDDENDLCQVWNPAVVRGKYGYTKLRSHLWGYEFYFFKTRSFLLSQSISIRRTQCCDGALHVGLLLNSLEAYARCWCAIATWQLMMCLVATTAAVSEEVQQSNRYAYYNNIAVILSDGQFRDKHTLH